MSSSNYESKKTELLNDVRQKLVDLKHDKLFTWADVEEIKRRHTGHLALAIAITAIVCTALIVIFHNH